MGQTVYADVLFLINFSMDFLVFYICARLSGNIMNYESMLAFRLCRRAFRYIFARYISTPLPNSRSRPRFPFPVSRFPFPSPHGSQRMPLQSLTLSSLQAYKSTSQRVKKKYPFRSLRQRRIGRSEWKEEVHESHLVPFRVISRT